MSFSSQIKEKLCKTGYNCQSCVLCELTGALMFGGYAEDTAVKFSTGNERVAKRVKADIEAAFGICAEIKAAARVHRIEIDDIYQAENISGGIPREGGIPFSCCRASFVRGAFLGGGSVTDPQKGYHMEFNTKSAKQALRLRELLAKDGFTAKITSRKGYSVVYVKGSEEIADIIGYMGAANLAFEMFNIQAEKEMRNSVNRRVNCENANTNKAAVASSRHLFAIKKIRDAKKWDKLPDVLKEIARLREEYPEDSLKELGERTDPPIGKSGVNHRLNRIVDFAESI